MSANEIFVRNVSLIRNIYAILPVSSIASCLVLSWNGCERKVHLPFVGDQARVSELTHYFVSCTA